VDRIRRVLSRARAPRRSRAPRPPGKARRERDLIWYTNPRIDRNRLFLSRRVLNTNSHLLGDFWAQPPLPEAPGARAGKSWNAVAGKVQ
jgi:hypothetical protein